MRLKEKNGFSNILVLVVLLIQSIAFFALSYYVKTNFSSLNKGVVQAAGNTYYVSATGSSSGDGSISKPWDLKTALNHPAVVRPGDTILLRGGTYGSGNSQYYEFKSLLTGSTNSYITVKSYPGENAKINGGIEIGLACGSTATECPITGDWVIYRDLEIFNSNTIRTSTGTGSEQPMPFVDGFKLFADNVKIINNVIHDTRQGIAAQSEGTNQEIYGNLIYNVGHISADRAHGHGLYIQNYGGYKIVKDNLFMQSLDPHGMNGYGENAVNQNLTVEGNIQSNKIFLISGGRVCHPSSTSSKTCACSSTCQYNQERSRNISVTNNYLWESSMQFGNIEAVGNGLIVKNNYLAGHNGVEATGEIVTQSVSLTDVDKFDFSNNTVCNEFLYTVFYNTARADSTRIWNNNTYCNWSGRTTVFRNTTSGSNYDFSGWKSATGYDVNSTYKAGTFTTAKPLTNVVNVRPNAYEAKRGNIAIYNWENKSVVAVNVSNLGLVTGDKYEIRNAQNYFGDTPITGTYSDSPISIDMSASRWTMAKPNGYTTVGKLTFPYFGAFILRVAGSGPISNTPLPIPTIIPTPTTQTSPSTPTPTLAPSTPVTGNIIRNSGFEDGNTQWNFYTNGQGTFNSTTPAFQGSKGAKINISTAGSNVQLYQSGLALAANTKYTLNFTARSNTSHDLQVFLHQHTSPYTSFGLSEYSVDLTNSWKNYTITFTTSGFSGTVSDARLRFWLAPFDSAGDEYNIDSVTLTKATVSTPAPTSTPIPSPTSTPTPSSPNLIVNPGFDSQTQPWFWYTNGSGNYTISSPGYAGSTAGKATIIQPGTNVQLSQRNITLQPNTKYKLSFAAKSNTGHDAQVSIFKDVSPYTNYGLSSFIANLDTSYKVFTVEFTTKNFSTNVSDARLMFYLAENDLANDVYYFDSVSLVKVN